MSRTKSRRAESPTIDRSHLVDGKYSIEDLVDIEQLRRLFEQFSQATGFTTGFVSFPEQKILIATGWRDLCTQFHRVCPASAQICRQSNIALTARLAKGQALNIERCGHGLADGATPVIVRGKHLASLATGQVLLEPPNLEQFKAQAGKYGYDAQKYLAALSQVPVVSAERLRSVLSFLSGVATFIAEQALTNLQLGQTTRALQQEIAERKRAEVALQEAKNLSDTLIDSMPGIFYVLDRHGAHLRWNKTLEDLYGLSPEGMATLNAFSNIHEEDREKIRRRMGEVFRQGSTQAEARLLVKGGGVRHFFLTGRRMRLGRSSVLLGNGIDVTDRKRLEQELLQISEREQRRIALDLHDGLCQRLVATGFTAEALYRELSGSNQGAAKTARLIGDLLDTIITDARRLSRGLHPVMAEPNGLMSALSELADTVSNLCRMRCRVECPKPVLLRDNATATHLFRIAQEAVNNAVKHGKATHVLIRLQRGRRGLSLQVRDNGVGLPKNLPAQPGLGLQIIHYRAGMIGATVQFRRGTRRGTIVSCTLPKRRARLLTALNMTPLTRKLVSRS